MSDSSSQPKREHQNEHEALPDRSSNPHDALFKAIFSVPEYFAAFLRERLPPKVVACLGAGSPELMDKSFITAQREVHCDLLYRLPLNTGKGDHLFVPLEHKSTPDSRIHLQMLRYQLLIWERHAGKASQRQRRQLQLPPLIPLVVYNGRQPWRIPQHFPGQFKDCGAVSHMAAEMADFRHLFIDLRQTPLERLSRHPELWALLAILRGDPGGSKAERQALLTRIARQLPQRDIPRIQRAAIEAMLYVASNWGDYADDFLVQQIPAKSGGGERLVGKFAREWHSAGKAESLIDLMEHRFGDLTAGDKAQVTQASPDDLKVWTLRVLDAPSVDEVFNGKGKPGSSGKSSQH